MATAFGLHAPHGEDHRYSRMIRDAARVLQKARSHLEMIPFNAKWRFWGVRRVVARLASTLTNTQRVECHMCGEVRSCRAHGRTSQPFLELERGATKTPIPGDLQPHLVCGRPRIQLDLL